MLLDHHYGVACRTRLWHRTVTAWSRTHRCAAARVATPCNLNLLALDILHACGQTLLPSLQQLEDKLHRHPPADASTTVLLASLLAVTTELNSVASGLPLLLSSDGSLAAMQAQHVTASVSASIAEQEDERREVLKAGARLLVAAGAAEQRVLGDPGLYAAVRAEAGEGVGDSAALAGHEAGSGPSGPATGAEAGLARLLLTQMRRQGYHPDRGGSSYSVALSREDKLERLATLRQQERALIASVQDELYSPGACPQVEVGEEELAQDPVLAAVLRHQQGRLEGLQSSGLAQGEVSVSLDLESAGLLLRFHPNRGVRRQVYEQAVETRCLAVLDHWEGLAEVRRKIALVHDYGYYAELAHLDTLAGDSSAAVAFLEELAHTVRPQALQRLQEWRQQLAEAGEARGTAAAGALQPWDLEWASRRHQHQHLEGDQQVHGNGWLQSLSIGSVMAGLSAYLHTAMGVHLQPFSGAMGHTGPQAARPWHGSIEALLHGLSGVDTSSDSNALVYAVEVEGRGLTGALVVVPRGGFGTRYLTHAGLGAGPMGLPVVLVGLHWRQHAWQQQRQQQQQHQHQQHQQHQHQHQHQHQVADDRLAVAAGSLLELAHEVGHGLHFLLSHSSSRSSGGAGRPDPVSHPLGHPLGLASWPGPAELPLELLEVPSTLFEILAMQPEVLQQLLPPGADVQAVARCMREAANCPIRYQVQVLTMLLDQLLVSRSNGLAHHNDPLQAGEAGRAVLAARVGKQHPADTWAQLCAEFLPGLPPCFTLQQASSLLRVVEARGQAHAYPAARCLACDVAEATGIAHDALDPAAGRQLRARVLQALRPGLEWAEWSQGREGGAQPLISMLDAAAVLRGLA